jgi:hypothetical protein
VSHVLIAYSSDHLLSSRRRDTFAQPPVIVVVGPEARKYYLSKALLTYHSEFFKKAFQGPGKEAQEGVVRLDDVELTVCMSNTLAMPNPS